MLTLENRVAGAWVKGTGVPSLLHDPTTGQAIAQCSTGGVDMRAALAYARDVGGPKLRAMTFAARAAMLRAVAKALHAERDSLLDLETENGGNTRKDGKFDVDGANATLSAYAEWGARLGDTHILAEGDGLTLGRTPRFWGQHVLVPRHGVAIQVNAFNFPAWGFAEKAATAWLAGMPVLVKPATATAMVAERVVRLLVDGGVVPEGALSILCGPTGDLLEHLTGQDVLAFTGSAQTGYLIRSREALLRRSVRVNVEADSLNAAVLAPDVEPGTETWNLFLRDVVTDMTQKAGQKCTAIRRILVPAQRLADVEAEISLRLGAVRVGNPALPEVGMGPLATASQLRDVRDGVKRLMTECDLVSGSLDEPELVGATRGKGYFHGPVLLRSRDTAQAKVVHEHEVFGPVATLLPWDGDAVGAAEALRRGEGSLVASVFSDDREFHRRMVLEAGPWHGRLYLGSAGMAGQALGPGTVLAGSIHGGPGRAGGGEELGGLRGLTPYQQRVALQGDRAVIDKIAVRPAPGGPA